MSDPLKSCGVLIVKGNPIREFLLMRHADRWDLPKGHVDPGETEIECALRELEEETGISHEAIELDPHFRFTSEYRVLDALGRSREKLLVVFLGRLTEEVEIRPTEHPGFQWFPWPVTESIQVRTIDPLLEAVRRYVRLG